MNFSICAAEPLSEVGLTLFECRVRRNCYVGKFPTVYDFEILRRRKMAEDRKSPHRLNSLTCALTSLA